jgi:hypothetical protein
VKTLPIETGRRRLEHLGATPHGQAGRELGFIVIHLARLSRFLGLSG